MKKQHNLFQIPSKMRLIAMKIGSMLIYGTKK